MTGGTISRALAAKFARVGRCSVVKIRYSPPSGHEVKSVQRQNGAAIDHRFNPSSPKTDIGAIAILLSSRRFSSINSLFSRRQASTDPSPSWRRYFFHQSDTFISRALLLIYSSPPSSFNCCLSKKIHCFSFLIPVNLNQQCPSKPTRKP